jgi:NAD(P)H dehydrogenase (quinone)
MPTILIVYDSGSGNTEKMAHAVAAGVQKIEGVTANVQRADETTNDDLLEVDGIIAGSPVYYGLMSAKLKDFFDKSVEIHEKLEGKVGAAFTSSGGYGTGAETTIMSIIQAFLIHGMIVKGYSRGPTVHYGAAAKGSPDEKEIEACKKLGKATAELVLQLTK